MVNLRFGKTEHCARAVADLRLDVLIELGGFTGDSRLEILCHKPAPVQLSYLGYPGPTYLKSIDGWLGDSVLFEQLNDVDRNAHPLIELEGYMAFDTGGEPLHQIELQESASGSEVSTTLVNLRRQRLIFFAV